MVVSQQTSEQAPLDPKVVALIALARELGYVCKTLRQCKLEISVALCRTMINRLGTFIYQASHRPGPTTCP